MKRTATRLLACGAITLAGVLQGAAMPPLMERQAPAQQPDFSSAWRKSAPRKVDKLGDSKWDNTDGHDLREVKTEGEMKVLVLLVNFDDTKFTVSKDPRQTVSDMLNKPGFDLFGASGSAFDYYNTTSTGLFSPKFDVYGPIQLDKKEASYVSNDETYIDETGKEVAVYAPGRMVEEACRKIDGEVNFADYDSNGDGVVDFVYIFYAGQGATTGGNILTTIWPHAFTLQAAIGGPIKLDGVDINRYATSSELGSKRTLSGIGVFCHEFGHVLGLPDLYDTANNNGQASKCFTPGPFSLMDAGEYNNDSYTPPHFSSYERYALEWMLPVTVTGSASVTMLPISARNFAYKVPVDANPKEYFLLEARAPFGWDAYLDDWGMMVWHIDFDARLWADNVPNNMKDHQRIDLVEADNELSAGSRGTDLFPSSKGVCEFEANTSPAFLSWNKISTGYSLRSIQRHPDGSVSFDIIADNGKEMPGMKIDAPAGRLKSLGTDKATVAWSPVDGAKGYMITVYETASFDGSKFNKFADGYFYKDMGEATEAVIEGLTPGVSYGVTIYAICDNNASRSESPVSFTTMDSDATKAAAGVYATTADEGIRLSWDEVPGAESYLLTVATRKQGETSSTFTESFDNSRLSEGWSGTGRYETRPKYCGETTPSYRFQTNGAILTSPEYEREIKQISFWHRQRFDDATGRMDIYANTDRGTILAASLTGFDPEGAKLTVDLPAGTHSFSMAYTILTTGLDFYLDDLTLSFTDGPKDTPVSGYSEFKAEATEAIVTGLENDTEYVAYVVPVINGEKATRSNTLTFIPSKTSSVSDILAGGSEASSVTFSVVNGSVMASDPTAAFDIFAADGSVIARSANSGFSLPAKGIYIIRHNGGSAKILF